MELGWADSEKLGRCFRLRVHEGRDPPGGRGNGWRSVVGRSGAGLLGSLVGRILSVALGIGGSPKMRPSDSPERRELRSE